MDKTPIAAPEIFREQNEVCGQSDLRPPAGRLDKMVRSFSKQFANFRELSLQNLGNARKDVHVLHNDDGKPHARPADQLRILGDIRHEQIGLDEFRRIVVPQRLFQFGIPGDILSKCTGDPMHGQIIVCGSNATCGKNVIVCPGRISNFVCNGLELIGNDRNFSDVDAETPQFTRQKNGILISRLSRENFIPNDNNCCRVRHVQKL